MAHVSGAHQVVFALREHGADMEREVGAELDVLAQMAARRMRELAPKFQTVLANSIHVSAPEAMAREVRPGVEHAWYVEEGVKPGGKGLPRFFDPASASIVAWLLGTAFGGRAKARKGSKAFTAAELELRDRYEGLAWHIRNKGVRAQPFVAPTAKEMEPTVLSRLDLAVRRALAARPDAGSATA